MRLIYAMLLGFILDLIFGDPHGLIHPVQIIGWFIDKLKKGMQHMIYGCSYEEVREKEIERKAGVEKTAGFFLMLFIDGSTSFVLLVFLIYLPLSVLIPSSSGLATLSVPVVAPLGQFAGVDGDVVVTAFQSACGLVNLVTPTAAVVMGALALGRIPYEKWLKFVWKLMLLFLLLTGLLLVLAAALS